MDRIKQLLGAVVERIQGIIIVICYCEIFDLFVPFFKVGSVNGPTFVGQKAFGMVANPGVTTAVEMATFMAVGQKGTG